MRYGMVLAWVCLGALAACGRDEVPPAPKPAQIQSPVPKGRLPGDAVPTHYRVALTINPEEARFSGRTAIDVTLKKPMAQLYLHGRDLRVARAEVVGPDGVALSATYRQVDPSGVALLKFAHALPSGEATIVIEYDAPFSSTLNGLYTVRDGNESYVFSQMESIHARRVFPSFDEPGFKTKFDIVVTTPSENEIVSNTMQASETDAGNGMKRVTFRTTPALPTYLLAFAVGPLDIVQGPELAPSPYRRNAPGRDGARQGRPDCLCAVAHAGDYRHAGEIFRAWLSV